MYYQSKVHVQVAKPVLNAVIYVAGALVALAIAGGIVAIVCNAHSPSEFDILGATLSTWHVGVAFAALWLIVMLFVARSVIKHTYKLAKLPKEK